MSQAPKQLGVRLPARLNARLEALARAENNAVAATARRLLTQALDRLDEARSTEPPPQRAA